MDDLFGLPAGQTFQASGRGYALVHPEDVFELREKIAAALRNGETGTIVFALSALATGRSLGSKNMRMPRKTPNRGKLLVAGLVWDVTERKTLELSLQDADRRKDEFLATLAHELRNPLAPLRNGLQIARLTSQADSPFRGTVDMMDRQLTRPRTSRG